DLFDDVFNLLETRRPARIRAEARIGSLLGTTWFTGHGQREAVRALVCLPPDVTLIANLPTGSGKSVLAQLPPLLQRGGHYTLVVLPTVALAIDHATQLAQSLQAHEQYWHIRHLAFHSAPTPAQRKEGICHPRGRRQPVLFSSPESACGLLRSRLKRAA